MLYNHSVKTYNVKLLFSSREDEQLLAEALQLYIQLWDYLSTYVHKHEQFNKKILHDKTYYKCKKKFPAILSQMIIRAQHDVVAAYKSARKNGRFWRDIQEPFKKHNLSIRLDKRLYKMSQTEIRLSTLTKRINCSLLKYPRIEEMFKKYPVCDPLIFFRNGQFYLSISFDIPDVEVKGSSILGIDVGENRIATTSEGLCVSGKEFQEQKRKHRYNKKHLQTKKSSHSSRRKLRKNSRRDRNRSKNYMHHVSNKLLKTKCDVLVLEDLSGIKQKNDGKYRNRKRSQYSWRMLRDILTYKALFVSKRVATVNPYNTSKNDYRGVESGVRKGCRYYALDGVVFDADWNAAINIGQRYSSISGLPVSFSVPRDGALNYIGRLSQEPIVSSFSKECGKLRGFSPCSN